MYINSSHIYYLFECIIMTLIEYDLDLYPLSLFKNFKFYSVILKLKNQSMLRIDSSIFF